MEPAMHGAVRSKDIETVEKLLSEGVDVNTVSNERTPLDLAMELKFKKISLLILEHGGKSSKHNPFYSLGHAIRTGNKLVVKSILEIGSGANETCEYFGTPLHLSRTCEVTKILLAKGAKINARDRKGKTPIYVAARHNLVDIVLCLARRGADVNMPDNRGVTPLHRAAGMPGTSEVIKILLAKGAGINTPDLVTRTPLYMAVIFGIVDNVRCLARHGADVNSLDIIRWTPLHAVAAKSHMIEAIDILLAKGARINAKDQYGRTPIHMAAIYGAMNNARCLARHGAEVNLPNKHEALLKQHVWNQKGYDSIAEILLANGADENERTNHGS